MKMSEFAKKHAGDSDWGVDKGSRIYCSCGWEEHYAGTYVENEYRFDDHLDAEAKAAGIGHVPTIVNGWVDKMVEDRRGWTRYMPTMEAEDHQMNRIFNELYCNAEIMTAPKEKIGDLQFEYHVKRKGPLL